MVAGLLTGSGRTKGVEFNVACVGCGGDGDDNPTDPSGGSNNGGSGSISATIDGRAVDFSPNAAGLLDNTGLTITGGDQTGGSVIVFSLPLASGAVDYSNPGYGITLTCNGSAWLDDTVACTITTAETDHVVGPSTWT